MENTKITHEVHPYGITTHIPIAALLTASTKLYPNEIDDLPYLASYITESSRPLLHFHIFTHFPDTLQISQLFPSSPPPNHRQLLIQRLNHQLEIITDASALLDKIVEIDSFDSKARQDLKTQSYLSNPEATEYFIKFLESQGDDTAFDYHGSYTILIMESIIEALSLGS